MNSNAELLARRTAAVPRGVATAMPIFVERAENAEVWDVEGNHYVDFAGGIGALNVGHRHPKVIRAVREQLDRFTHTAFQSAAYEPYVRLAELLNALAPIEGPAKTVFFTTGAEATENAIKIARAATGRSAAIAFTGGFHGRTLLASALTGKTTPFKRGFGPLPGDIFHVPFPNDTRGVSIAQSLQALSYVFEADVAANNVAAIIIEPIQGEGGFHVAPPEFLRALRKICDDHGILLIVDEVQTGFARTGRMFAIEHSGVRPDILAIAKSLAGGFPLSGVIARADIVDRIEPGGLGGTFAGSPVSCAAGLAVLEVLEDESLVRRADEIGVRLRDRIAKFGTRDDLVPVSEPRGLGAMIAFDVLDRARLPDGVTAKRVCAAALQRGLMIVSCGTLGETIRVLVPLTVSDAVADEGLNRLEAALLESNAPYP